MATKFYGFGNDITIIGDIVLTGTVDGRDVTVDGIKLDSLLSNAENNIGSNIGVGGIGIFKQQVSGDNEFKNINGLSNISVVAVTNEVNIDVDEANITILNLSGAPTSTVVGTTDTQTMTNKTLTSPIISIISNTGTLTVPTITDTLIGRDTINTLTNKTFTSPIFSIIINTGILTLPTSTDTLIGRDTTNILTNKTINKANNTVTGLVNSNAGLGNVNNTLMNFSAIIDPVNTTDDITLGYTVGSRWLNLTSHEEFVLLDNTDSAAIWKTTTTHSETASNIGIGGVNVFKTISSELLQFKRLDTDDVINISDGANDNLDIELSIIGTPSKIIPAETTDNIIIYDISESDHKKVLLTNFPVGTGSSVGTAGIDTFNQQVLKNLEFKSITGVNTIIAIDDIINDKIDLSLNITGMPSSISPDYFSDFLISYDTSTASHKKILLNNLPRNGNGLNVGTGIGIFKQKVINDFEFKNINVSNKFLLVDDIINDKIDISFNIDSLPIGPVVDIFTDFIVYYDASTVTHRKLLINNIPNSSEFNTVSNVGTLGIGIFDKKVLVDLQFKKINSVNSGIFITDVSNDRVDFELDITALTEDVSPDINNDYVCVYDVSLETHNKTLLINIIKGEVNSGLNIGTSGFILFDGKTGVDFKFKNIHGFDGITSTDNIIHKEIDLTLDINGLTQFTPDPASDFIVVYDTTTALHNKVLLNNIPSSGELNSGSNLGTGISIFKAVNGFDYEFKRLNALSAIVITDDTINDNVDITLNINTLSSGTPNITTDFTVIYDTSATIHQKILLSDIPSSGQVNTTSSVGTIGVEVFKQKTLLDFQFKKLNSDNIIVLTNNNTEIELALDIHSLTEDLTPDLSADYVVIYDVSTATHKKTLLTTLVGLTGNDTNTVTDIGTAGVSIFDGKVGVDLQFKKINGINGILTTNIGNEIHTVFDINSLTSLVTLDPISDLIIMYDSVSKTHKKVKLTNIPSSGETNSVVNIGVGGVNLFKQKTGVDFEFKKINSNVSNHGILITDDVVNNEVNISFNINSLSSATSTIDTQDYIATYDTSSSTNKKVLLNVLPSAVTASNIGTLGIGLFKQQTGLILEFKNINSSTGITLTDNTILDELEIALDINALTVDGFPDPAADFIMVYDTSASVNKKVLLNNLPTSAGGETNTSSDIGTGIDILKGKVLFDFEFKKITTDLINNGITIINDVINNTVNIELDINSLAIATSPDVASDYIITYDSSAGTNKKVLLSDIPSAGGGEVNSSSNLGSGIGVFKQKVGVDFEFKKINSITGIKISDDVVNNKVNIDLYINTLTTFSDLTGTDFIVTYDTSTTSHKKVLLSNLPSVVGGEANTVSNIGVAGVGAFKQKAGANFEFKNINSSTGISVTDNIVLNDIDISIDINSLTEETSPLLTDFIVIYDTSAVVHRKSLLSNLPSTGGGEINTVSDLGSGLFSLFKQKIGSTFEFKNLNSNTGILVTNDTNNVNIALNINGLTEDTTPDSTADFIAIYDVATTTLNKLLLSNLPFITVSNLGTSGTGIFKLKTGSNLDFKKINSNTSDGILLTDNIITNEIEISLDINSLPIGIPITTDSVAIYDTSATTHKKILLSNLPSSLEANSAINIGTAGFGVFDGKVGVDIQFKSINSINGILITNAVTNNEVEISLDINTLTQDVTPDLSADFTIIYDVSTSLNKKVILNNLPNGEVNTVSSVGTGIGVFNQKTGVNFEFKNINANNTFIISDDTPNNNVNIALNINGLLTNIDPVETSDYITIYDTSAGVHKKILLNKLPSGESNTASNIGTSIRSVGIFKQKTGVDLEFKQIDSGSTIINVIDDSANHIDISLNIDGLTVDATPDAADFIISYDTSASTHKKVLISNLALGEINTSSNVGTGGVGIANTKVLLDLPFKKINSTTTGIIITDDINEVDVELDINGLIVEATPDPAADFIVIYDTSTTVFSKVLLNNIPNGEGNTSSNIGTGGIGIFKQKTGSDLEFKNINSTSTNTAIIVSDDGVNNKIDLTLNVNALVNESTPDISSDFTIIYDASTTSNKKVLLNNLPGSQKNTASNIGTDGIGLFKQKVIIDLEFKQINVNAGLVLINNTDDIAISLDINGLVTDSTPIVSTDYLLIYDPVAVAHKKVLLNSLPVPGGGEANTVTNVGIAGTGIFKQKTGVDFEYKKLNTIGTGIIIAEDAANNEIDISLDLNGLSTTTVDLVNDFIVTYDTSTLAHRKVVLSTFPSGEVNTSSNVGTGGVGLFKQKSGVNLQYIQMNTESTLITLNDDIGNDKIDIEIDINGQFVDASPDKAADFLLIYDSSSNSHKQVLLENIPSITVENINPLTDFTNKFFTTGFGIGIILNGIAYGAGSNWTAQLGLNNTISSFNTLQKMNNGPSGFINGTARFIHAGAATNAAAVIDNNDVLYVCGQNRSLQFGFGTFNGTVLELTKIPDVPLGFTNGTVFQVGLEGSTTFILMNDKSLYCCGVNSTGQFGNGTLTDTSEIVLVNTGIPNIDMMHTSTLSSFISTTDGLLYGTGYNLTGVLGLGHNINRNTWTLVTGIPIFTQISVNRHAGIVSATGQVYMVGNGDNGSLGFGNTLSLNTFTLIPDVGDFVNEDIKSVHCSGENTLILKTNGQMYYIGSSTRGQNGVNFTSTNIPLLHPTLTGITFLTANVWSSIAFVNNILLGFGYNQSGALGVGNSTASITTPTPLVIPSEPVTVNPGTDFTDKLDAIGFHVVVILNGVSYGAGANENGQLGLGNTTRFDTFQRMNDGPSGFVNGTARYITGATNSSSTVVIDNNDVVYVCGHNGTSKFGFGVNNAPVLELTKLPDVSLGFTNGTVFKVLSTNRTTHILMNDKSLYCCGSNASGQFGNGNNTNVSEIVLVNTGVANIDSIYADVDTAFIITTGGLLYSTGSNSSYGALGLGDNTNRNTFTLVTGIPLVSKISVYQHVGIVSTAGQVYMAGSGSGGKMGLGNTLHVNTFTLIPDVGDFVNADIKSVHCGGLNSLILKNNGQMYYAGESTRGQNGGNFSATNVPLLHPTLTNITFLSVGGNQSVGFINNVLTAFGDNNGGSLGVGHNGAVYTPTPLVVPGTEVSVLVTTTQPGIFKQKVGAILEFKKMNGLTGILLVDDTGNDEIDISLNINGLTADITPDNTTDFTLTYDTSTSSHKKILLSDLLTPINIEVTATTNDDITSTTFVTIDSMTSTPISGTYLVSFSASLTGSVINQLITYALFKDAVEINESERLLHNMTTHTTVIDLTAYTQFIITVNGSEVITVKLKSSINNMVTIYERSLILLKLS
jgi:alpha-tubulin suppressor-like RCC1 family protein